MNRLTLQAGTGLFEIYLDELGAMTSFHQKNAAARLLWWKKSLLQLPSADHLCWHLQTGTHHTTAACNPTEDAASGKAKLPTKLYCAENDAHFTLRLLLLLLLAIHTTQEGKHCMNRLAALRVRASFPLPHRTGPYTKSVKKKSKRQQRNRTYQIKSWDFEKQERICAERGERRAEAKEIPDHVEGLLESANHWGCFDRPGSGIKLWPKF